MTYFLESIITPIILYACFIAIFVFLASVIYHRHIDKAVAFHSLNEVKSHHNRLPDDI